MSLVFLSVGVLFALCAMVYPTDAAPLLILAVVFICLGAVNLKKA